MILPLLSHLVASRLGAQRESQCRELAAVAVVAAAVAAADPNNPARVPITSTAPRRHRPGRTLGDRESPDDFGTRPATKGPEGCDPIDRKSHHQQETHNASSKKLALQQSDSKLHPPRHGPKEVQDRLLVGPLSKTRGSGFHRQERLPRKTLLAEQTPGPGLDTVPLETNRVEGPEKILSASNPWSLRLG